MTCCCWSWSYPLTQNKSLWWWRDVLEIPQTILLELMCVGGKNNRLIVTGFNSTRIDWFDTAIESDTFFLFYFVKYHSNLIWLFMFWYCCIVLKLTFTCLEVLAQLTNAEIARPDVMTRVRTRDLTVVCEFIFSGLPLHLKPKKKKKRRSMSLMLNILVFEKFRTKFQPCNKTQYNR